ncbi:YqcC family protein [Delftia sp. PS-11]|uniref:YqcC family protein n=1 Tax=Delftia sp. PS-11 TaxID=2767222 RepID=UPI002455A1FB|nr:YqcC family protein [Delftia sp. PS-11]KAJ8746350.1 YqcC family protein [Delftia sp. PS-11]
MMPDAPHQPLLDHLQQLEDEMRRQNLWSPTAPSAQAMASTMPFMYDTLKLHEWLQWVFLPRLRAVVDAGGQLPCQSHVHPLAEHEWSQPVEFDKRHLLALLLRIDETLNHGSLTPPEAAPH